MDKARPGIRIRFTYNKDTGEIEEFIIDDQAPDASEAYHDKVAHAIAGRMARDPEIEDAGPVRLPQGTPQAVGPLAGDEEQTEAEQEADSLRRDE
jgi:plasmid stabilization system protein ParE